jgi:signal transduction histidine kinase
MTFLSRTIYIISSDAVVAERCASELSAFGGRYRTQVTGAVDQARKGFIRNAPAAIFLDESAVDACSAGETLGAVAAVLRQCAPVVVAGVPEKQTDLIFLITSGAVDFVARAGNFAPIVAGMLDRRARMAERSAGTIQFPNEGMAGDFGEILRHEVNNPLTGILGNTELLLARRDRLPPAAVERLETIAELAVRLRETVRRLSNAWDERHEHARPA